jgi:hypothetical protein
MNKPNKTPVGFVVVGTLTGAALGAVWAAAYDEAVYTVAGSVLGMVAGIAIDVLSANVRLRVFDVVLVGLILVVVVSLFRRAPPAPQPDEWDRLLQQFHALDRFGQKQAREREQGRLMAEAFLADVGGNRLDKAHDTYTAVWNRDVGREAFAAVIRKQPSFKNPQLPLRGEVLESPPYGTYKYICQAEAEGERVAEVAIMVGSKDGTLGIFSFSVTISP